VYLTIVTFTGPTRLTYSKGTPMTPYLKVYGTFRNDCVASYQRFFWACLFGAMGNKRWVECEL
jgi:hypothetical protein